MSTMKYSAKKINAIGIDPSWFCSYLTGRSQIVTFNGIQSFPLEISCGVPQGSLLGPLLYLIYSNDMEIAVKHKLLLYADDSIILVCHKDPEVISQCLSKELDSVNNWLIDNKLSLHVGKTECILFGSKRKLNKVANFQVHYRDHIIKGSNCVKYLGVTLDQDLSGNSIVSSIVPKALGKLKFLYRYGDCLNVDLRRKLCNALIQCHLDYCCTAWYASLSQKMKQKLQITQTRSYGIYLSLDHVVTSVTLSYQASSISIYQTGSVSLDLIMFSKLKVAQVLNISDKTLNQSAMYMGIILEAIATLNIMLNLSKASIKLRFMSQLPMIGTLCLFISRKSLITIVLNIRLNNF